MEDEKGLDLFLRQIRVDRQQLFEFLSPESDDKYEEEVSDESERKILGHIAMLRNVKYVLQGLAYINEQISLNHQLISYFESPSPLFDLQNWTNSENIEISTLAWKVVRKICGHSEFCCGYFIDHGILQVLCEILLTSQDIKISYNAVKLLHYIANQDSKEIYENLYRQIQLNSIDKRISPIQAVLIVLNSQVEEFAIPGNQLILNLQQNHDENLNKFRLILLKFTIASLQCNFQNDYNLEICEALVKSLYFPFAELRIVAMISIQKAFSNFREFIFDPYKSYVVGALLMKFIEDPNKNIAIESLQTISRIIKAKQEERVEYSASGIFEALEILFNQNVNSNDQLSIEIIYSILDFLHIYCKYIPESTSDEEISFILSKNIIWMLFDFANETDFNNKCLITIIICHVILKSTLTIVESILDKRGDLISLICSVLEEQNKDHTLLYLQSLDYISVVYINRGNAQQMVELFEEHDVQDLIDDLIDEGSNQLKVIASKLKTQLLGENQE